MCNICICIYILIHPSYVHKSPTYMYITTIRCTYVSPAENMNTRALTFHPLSGCGPGSFFWFWVSLSESYLLSAFMRVTITVHVTRIFFIYLSQATEHPIWRTLSDAEHTHARARARRRRYERADEAAPLSEIALSMRTFFRFVDTYHTYVRIFPCLFLKHKYFVCM